MNTVSAGEAQREGKAPLFRRLLIANRGEIACRVIRTARRMGIETVAVYSEADARALHVAMADESVLIGPPAPLASYLSIDNLLQACRDSGADAVHPGYGFLSENPVFCQRLEAEGITFIGPKAASMALLGDKIASKELARSAGVSTIPGTTEAAVDVEDALTLAADIGYPVMIKASAGGGGRGLRVAWNEPECREYFASCQSEARTAFGDDRILIEKFIAEPRHIEIQVLGDAHGTVLHLWERECSIQRRHQKVFEEAPSPFLDEATRTAMAEQAVELAKAARYQSAGTVEFVVGADRSFYFLEMNTRLQVEHPVTEFITGLDLVEQMIRVAAGEPLAFDQAAIRRDGWAIEARVCAEDPARDFLPSAGRLVRYAPPPEVPGRLRVDTGVVEGGSIPQFYDSLVAKVIGSGTSRDEALGGLRDALNAFVIRGISSNLPFLTTVLQHPRFLSGDFTTGFVAEEYPTGLNPAQIPIRDPLILAVVAAYARSRYINRAVRITGQLPGHARRVGSEWVVLLRGEQIPVRLEPLPGGANITVDGESLELRSDWRLGEILFRGTLGDREICVQIERRGIHYRLSHLGGEVDTLVMTTTAAELLALMPEKLAPDSSRFLLSPMPGALTEIAVVEGQQVHSGEKLVVIEAMKMENVLRAETAGTVAQVLVQVGDTVAVDQPLLEFSRESALDDAPAAAAKES
jgi:propionyl-CoA carboxylase alpha chain